MYNKLTFLLLWLLAATVSLVSCSSTRSHEIAVAQPQRQTSGCIIIDKSGQTFINENKIVVGLGGEDYSFKRATTIIKGKGRELEVVRDCSAIAAIRLNGDEQDTLTKVNNVTVINRDTIEIHTKALVDKYRHQIKTTTNTDRPYEYLRFIGMTSEGEGNRLINEGVIRIFFDHDPTADFRVYGFGICGNANSAFINRGKIEFLGKGSPLTRMRGMGTMAGNVSFVNDGTIIIDVEMSEDARMITSGGNYNDIINNGVMKGRSSGSLLGMTRYGDSHIVNNGTIDLTVAKMPDGFKPVLANSEKFTCAFFEMMNTGRTHIPPMNNRGTVSITLDDVSDPNWCGAGMYVGMVKPCDANMTIHNDGIILLNEKGNAPRHLMSEAYFVNRTPGGSPINIAVGHWRTRLHDFKSGPKLFCAKGEASIDLGGAKISFMPGDNPSSAYDVSHESLLLRADNTDRPIIVTGYDKIHFSAADNDYIINRNQSNKTITLTKQN